MLRGSEHSKTEVLAPKEEEVVAKNWAAIPVLLVLCYKGWICFDWQWRRKHQAKDEYLKIKKENSATNDYIIMLICMKLLHFTSNFKSWNAIKHFDTLMYLGEWYNNLIQGLQNPWVFQEFNAPRFHDSRQIKVERLLAVRTSRLYPPGNVLGTHFC